jgi:RIO-like serine/threonine protein kinase
MGLSPFDYRLYHMIRDYQDKQQRLVTTRVLESRLSLPQRTVRHYLSRLVGAGMLFRPEGIKSGYSVMPVSRSMAVREATKWKAAMLDSVDVAILRSLLADGRKKTGVLAKALGFKERRLRYRMLKLESLELVWRPAGAKSGYETQAIAKEVMALADAKQQLDWLSPLRLGLLQRMTDLAQDDPLRLHSENLAVWADMKPRTMRYHLNALEKRGLIIRPQARNGGYELVKVVVNAVLDLAREEGLLCHA